MKKFFSVLIVLLFAFAFPQKFDNIQSGETLNYRIHYGILNAGTATLTTLKTTYLGQPHFYVKGIGKTTGAVRAFFKVEDLYESFINYNTGFSDFNEGESVATTGHPSFQLILSIIKTRPSGCFVATAC